MQCKNGIIFFDEFDKVMNSMHGAEVINALIHIADSTQTPFQDFGHTTLGHF